MSALFTNAEVVEEVEEKGEVEEVEEKGEEIAETAGAKGEETAEKLTKKRKREDTEDKHSSSTIDAMPNAMPNKIHAWKDEWKKHRFIVNIMLRHSKSWENLLNKRTDFKYIVWAQIQEEVLAATGLYIEDHELSAKLVYFRKMYALIRIMEVRGYVFEGFGFNCDSRAWAVLGEEFKCHDVIRELQFSLCDYYNSLMELGSQFLEYSFRATSNSGSGSERSSSRRPSQSSSGASQGSLMAQQVAHHLAKQVEECLSVQMAEMKSEILQSLVGSKPHGYFSTKQENGQGNLGWVSYVLAKRVVSPRNFSKER